MRPPPILSTEFERQRGKGLDLARLDLFRLLGERFPIASDARLVVGELGDVGTAEPLSDRVRCGLGTAKSPAPQARSLIARDEADWDTEGTVLRHPRCIDLDRYRPRIALTQARLGRTSAAALGVSNVAFTERDRGPQTAGGTDPAIADSGVERQRDHGLAPDHRKDPRLRFFRRDPDRLELPGCPLSIEEIGGGERRGQREIEREIADILVPHPLVDLLAQPVQRARLFVVAGERKQQKETTARRLQRRVRRQLERREQPADGDFDNQLEAQRAAAKHPRQPANLLGAKAEERPLDPGKVTGAEPKLLLLSVAHRRLVGEVAREIMMTI